MREAFNRLQERNKIINTLQAEITVRYWTGEIMPSFRQSRSTGFVTATLRNVSLRWLYSSLTVSLKMYILVQTSIRDSSNESCLKLKSIAHGLKLIFWKCNINQSLTFIFVSFEGHKHLSALTDWRFPLTEVSQKRTSGEIWRYPFIFMHVFPRKIIFAASFSQFFYDVRFFFS